VPKKNPRLGEYIIDSQVKCTQGGSESGDSPSLASREELREVLPSAQLAPHKERLRSAAKGENRILAQLGGKALPLPRWLGDSKCEKESAGGKSKYYGNTVSGGTTHVVRTKQILGSTMWTWGARS